MTPEEQRKEKEATIKRERKAFERRQNAFFIVQRQFLPHGNGAPTDESLDELSEADNEWREATADVECITKEILSGKRR